MKKAAIAACSDALLPKDRPQIEELTAFLRTIGIETEMSDCIYSDGCVFAGTPSERAAQLMKFFTDSEIDQI